jgi:hypothetical protein
MKHAHHGEVPYMETVHIEIFSRDYEKNVSGNQLELQIT